MYISYSGFHLYVGCGYAYWNEYINRTPKSGPDDRLGSLYGSAVGKIFEDFYNLKVWREKDPQEFLLSRVDATVDKLILDETSPGRRGPGGVLLWKGEGPGQNPRGMYKNVEELKTDVRDAIPRGLRIIRHYRLVGPRTDAEFKLDYKFEGDVYGGRSDFIIQRVAPHRDLVIVDGKGSQHRGKYVSPKQLLWYAMLFWLTTGKLPDKLAFLFWRYEVSECMDWVEVTEADVEGLFEEAREAMREIAEREKMMLPGVSPETARGIFKPKANENNCRFCPYSHVCPQGKKVQGEIEARAARKRI